MFKQFYIKYFDRYTAWELKHRNMPCTIRENGKEEVFIANVYTRFDRHRKRSETKNIVVYRDPAQL